MLFSRALGASARSIRSSRTCSRPEFYAARCRINPAARSFARSARVLERDLPGANDEHEGTMSRTDKTIQVEHPDEEEYPSSQPVQGRGGMHFRRTLASFSLEGRVGIVTGGSRGLGLVMAQAMAISGADVAIVDLNSRWLPRLALHFTCGLR